MGSATVTSSTPPNRFTASQVSNFINGLINAGTSNRWFTFNWPA